MSYIATTYLYREIGLEQGFMGRDRNEFTSAYMQSHKKDALSYILPALLQ